MTPSLFRPQGVAGVFQQRRIVHVGVGLLGDSRRLDSLVVGLFAGGCLADGSGYGLTGGLTACQPFGQIVALFLGERVGPVKLAHLLYFARRLGGAGLRVAKVGGILVGRSP